MQLQAATEYAIRIVSYLHTHNNELSTAMAISKGTDVTYPFLIKIANTLKQSGLLSTVQGRDGGYMLAKPADEISIYDIFLAIEGELKLKSCLKNKRSCNRGAQGKCSTRDYFLLLQNSIIKSMSGQYIADFSK